MPQRRYEGARWRVHRVFLPITLFAVALVALGTLLYLGFDLRDPGAELPVPLTTLLPWMLLPLAVPAITAATLYPYLLKHLRCPQCGATDTQWVRSRERTCHIRCEHCYVAWDTGMELPVDQHGHA